MPVLSKLGGLEKGLSCRPRRWNRLFVGPRWRVPVNPDCVDVGIALDREPGVVPAVFRESRSMGRAIWGNLLAKYRRATYRRLVLLGV